MPSRLPVTVVTGFLGTGKTTLLRHLLTKGDQRLAVMVNEFGSVGLDGDLIRSCGFCSDEDIEGRLVELNNGCLCCTVQDDFLPTMEALLARSKNLDGIVIETSGLALPRPLLQALDWPAVRTRVRINGVVTLVDGEALTSGTPIGDIKSLERQREADPSIDHLTPVDELFADQLSAADLVLISRADRVSSNDLQKVKADISAMAPSGIPMIPISYGEIDPSIVLGNIHGGLNGYRQVDDKHHVHDHNHVDMVSGTICLEIDIDRLVVENLLSSLSAQHNIIRLKGRIWLPGKNLPLQIQMVGPRLSSWFEAAPSTAWRPETTGLELVVISFTDETLDSFRLDLENLLLKRLKS